MSAEGGRWRKTSYERECVSLSVAEYQSMMALKRTTEVQLMHDAHTVALTSIFLTVEKNDVKKHVTLLASL